jgi:hypothetical protein
MKFQKKVSVQGEWVKVGEDIKDGDIITIANEGKVITGDFGDRPVFKVATKNGEKNLSFNQTTMNNLIDAYGEESNEWQGEKIKVWIMRQSVGGKPKNVVFLTAPEWLLGDDGFYNPKGDIPVIEEEVKTDEIPF